MESPSLAALLISVLAFLDVAFSQDSQQLSYLLSGGPAFGDRSGFELGPRRYVFESGNALGAASDASSSNGAGRFGIVPGGYEKDYTGRADGVENFANSDVLPYGGIKRISRRGTILIVIRRRRPRWQGSSGSEDDGGKWGRVDDDYPSDDQSTNERRRAGRALLSMLLRKLLLAALSRRLARDGSDEGQGRDFRSGQPWRRSERGWRSGWRFGEGSDSGLTDTYDDLGSRWAREGLGADGGRLLLRMRRRNDGDSSGFYLVGSGRGLQNGPRWVSSENAAGASSAITGSNGEEGGRVSDATGIGADYGVFSNVANTGTAVPGNPFTGMSRFASGRFADSRGFGGSLEGFPAQPSTRQEPSSSENQPNQGGYGNEGGSFGNIGSNYYPRSLPRLIIRLPRTYIPSAQTGGLGGNYDSAFGGTPESGVSVDSNNEYSGGFGGLPGGNQIGSGEFSGPYDVNNAAGVSAPSVNPQWSQKG